MATVEIPAQQYERPRRWKRHNFDLAVLLRVDGKAGTRTVQACGRQLNEGGMGMFAGTELQIGQKVEVEFTPPYADLPVRLKAEVRNRNEYYYGLEFVATTVEEQQEIDLLRLLVQALTGYLPETTHSS